MKHGLGEGKVVAFAKLDHTKHGRYLCGRAEHRRRELRKALADLGFK
jgi:hypothetical protein